MRLLMSSISQALFAAVASAQLSAVPTVFTVPGPFPTSVFSTYYNNPTATSAQPQPVISDPVSHLIYELSLTDPNEIPLINDVDPRLLPSPASPSAIVDQGLAQLNSIFSNPNYASNGCAQCQAILAVVKFVSLAAPQDAFRLTEAVCKHYKVSPNCTATHSQSSFGPILVQVLSLADVSGYDGQTFCHSFLGQCPLPQTVSANLTTWFTKPKPNPLPPPKTPSGKRLKVLHLTDFHLDPRYATGSEGNCTVGSPCCRTNAFNANSNVTVFPAPRFGAFKCDTPLSLGLAALQSIPTLTGTVDTGFDWTIYTGDLVSHDAENQLSRDYVLYTETVVYDLFKRLLNAGPVYAALGNHDTYDSNSAAPLSIGGELANQFSWNYDHLASLWEYEGWVSDTVGEFAKAHYAAYSVNRGDGLRIISLDGNFWYKSNYFNYMNMTNPDNSGMLRFLTDELQDAEDAGDRVWIIAHVLTGWDGSNDLLNPTDLFYQIVNRFSPHVIANIFYGHTHEDQFSIIYANNGTVVSADMAQVVTWIGPSITPITNLNSGFRVYEVDSATFDVLDAHTWISDVSSFATLDSQTEVGPTYQYLYNTREAYGGSISSWGQNDPLNATWWHLVTQAMEADPSLVGTFTKYQGKDSVLTPACTGECVTAKICYMRSGSSSIATERCQQGFGSVQ